MEENGRIFGGSERHLGIVRASTLTSGGPMGEVYLERLLHGVRAWSSSQCELSRSCVDLCGFVGRWCMRWCKVYSPPVQIHRLIVAELRLRYDNDKSPRL